MLNKILILSTFLCLVLYSGLCASTVRADQQPEPVATPAASNLSDPRLPPVIPGEEVVRSGKKIKVWSSSGSPSVAGEVPEAPKTQDQWQVSDQPGDVSVFVDGRDYLPHKNHHKPRR